MKPFGLPKSARLRSASEYKRVYDGGERIGDHLLLVYGAANNLGRTRAGVSVSRKHGNAVRRARLKRLPREAYRLEQQELPQGLDIILIPRQQTAAEVDDFRRSIHKLTERLAHRLGLVRAS